MEANKPTNNTTKPLPTPKSQTALTSLTQQSTSLEKSPQNSQTKLQPVTNQQQVITSSPNRPQVTKQNENNTSKNQHANNAVPPQSNVIVHQTPFNVKPVVPPSSQDVPEFIQDEVGTLFQYNNELCQYVLYAPDEYQPQEICSDESDSVFSCDAVKDNENAHNAEEEYGKFYPSFDQADDEVYSIDSYKTQQVFFANCNGKDYRHPLRKLQVSWNRNLSQFHLILLP